MSLDVAKLEQLVSRLARQAKSGTGVQDIQLIHTHISIVLLAGDTAYKFKKPVNLGFVDLTSPPKTVPVFKLETRLNWTTKEVKHAEKTLLTRRDHQTPTLS